MRFFDIGANLLDPMFKGIYHGKQYHVDDLISVLQRSKSSLVDTIILTSGTVNDTIESLDFISKNKQQLNLYTTAGIHPTRASQAIESLDETFLELERLAQNDQVIAIGECGLDYERLHFSNEIHQKQVFVKHFELAHKTQKPLFLHNRKSSSDLISILREHRHLFTKGVVHSFDDSLANAKIFIDELDLFIGLNGCSLKNQENLDVVKELPLDRILIETDAPWCEIKSTHASYAHVKHLGNYSSFKKEKYQPGSLVKGRNEPCELIQIASVISDLKETDLESVAESLYKNSIQFFSIS